MSTVSLARSVRSNANFHLDIINNHVGDEALDASSVGGYHNYVEVCRLPAVGGTIPWMEFWNLKRVKGTVHQDALISGWECSGTSSRSFCCSHFPTRLYFNLKLGTKLNFLH